jgi:hypothetical protein
MQCDTRKVESALSKKGFEMDNTHHHVFTYHTVDGRRTMVRTRTSHGAKTIGDPLIAQMARQCKLNKADFLQLVECPLSRDMYEEILSTQGALPRNESKPAER